MHKIFFYNKFIIRLYMFRALCAHHQEVKIVLYSFWYHHTCRWPSGAQVRRHRTATYRCDDTCACFASPPNWFGARNKGRVILSLDVNSAGNAEVYREFLDLSMKITEYYVY